MDPQLLCSVAQLSNDALLARVRHLAQRERDVTALLIAYLAELDVLERLEDGSVTLTTVTLLAAHLTQENHLDVLDIARHKSKRQIEELVARLRPQPDVPASVRKLPTISRADSPQSTGAAQNELSLALASGGTPPPAPPAIIAPLAPHRYKVQFTASAETYEKLRFAQALLRHQIPDGDPAKIFDRALTALLKDLTKKKLAGTDCPRESHRPVSGSRYIPAEVKRAVWTRDGGRCAFVSRAGRRCTEQGFLEFHHIAPHAAGGKATAANIQLRCRAHNGYEAERYFGPCKLAVREARALYRTAAPAPATGRPPTTPSGTSYTRRGHDYVFQ